MRGLRFNSTLTAADLAEWLDIGIDDLNKLVWAGDFPNPDGRSRGIYSTHRSKRQWMVATIRAFINRNAIAGIESAKPTILPSTMTFDTTGTLAKKFGRSRETIKYYDTVGVIHSQRDAAGRRLFDAEQEVRLRDHLRRAGKL